MCNKIKIRSTSATAVVYSSLYVYSKCKSDGCLQGAEKTNLHFWLYLTQFVLEWEMFQTEVVEKIKHTF